MDYQETLTTQELLLNRSMKTAEQMEQIQITLNSILNTNTSLPDSIEKVLFTQLKSMQDSQQKLQDQIETEFKRSRDQNAQTICNIQVAEEYLGETTEKIIRETSAHLLSPIQPGVRKVQNDLQNLSSDINSKSSELEKRIGKLKIDIEDIRVYRAYNRTIAGLAISFVLGLVIMFFACRAGSKGLINRLYSTEISNAQTEAVQDFKKHLIKDRAGIMEIWVIEKDYILKHKDTDCIYSDPDARLETLTSNIEWGKENLE